MEPYIFLLEDRLKVNLVQTFKSRSHGKGWGEPGVVLAGTAVLLGLLADEDEELAEDEDEAEVSVDVSAGSLSWLPAARRRLSWGSETGGCGSAVTELPGAGCNWVAHRCAKVATAEAWRSPRYAWSNVSCAVAGMYPSACWKKLTAHGKWTKVPVGCCRPAV